jgi:acyl-CoA synthetase (AMP-forming)/AMP-acid ligase II
MRQPRDARRLQALTSDGARVSLDWGNLLAASADSQKPWLILPSDPRRNEDCRTISYADLSRAALGVARGLLAAGARRGDRIAVIADNHPETCMFLLGALLSGIVIVPIAPTGFGVVRERWLQSVIRICRHCEPILLAGRTTKLPPSSALDPVRMLSIDQLGSSAPFGLTEPSQPSAKDIAILQYTSGTTSSPRGVELSHDNVFCNLSGIGQILDISSDDVGVTWLPLFHDMGLIGSLLFGTYFNMSIVFMSPADFAMTPERWLWAISRFKVTCCAAPNAAYAICATRVPDRKLEGLDLSAWRVALSGSELVHAETMEAFSKRLGKYGFRSAAMCPAYGLAESSVAATLSVPGRGPRVDCVNRARLERDGVALASEETAPGTRRVVCVGRPLPGHEARIVHPETKAPVPLRHVGTIELRGPSIMQGYYRAPELTAEAISQSGWLLTGDRGYLSDDGLHILGRDKDIFKRAGRSHDSADVQSAVEALADVHGRVAVFGVPSPERGTEDLVVLVETRTQGSEERAALESAISRTIAENISLRPDRIAFVAPGTIPRTTSGKVQHDRARDLYCTTLPVCADVNENESSRS